MTSNDENQPAAIATTGRYHRQMLLPGIGAEGQRRLGESHAMVVGCGALGCAICDQLGRAGVGTITIIDRDTVELTNIQRQILFDEADAARGAPKAQAAAERLGKINSSIRVRAEIADLGPRNAEKLVLSSSAGRPGVIVDGTDNFQTRYLLNDLCVKHSIPLVYGGAVGTCGMSMTILPGERGPGTTPCLRCLFDQPPPPGSTPTCDTAGVLGPVTTVIGAIQAAEAIKVLAGKTEAAQRGLLEVDLWSGRVHRLDLSKAKLENCVCCVGRQFAYLAGEVAVDTTVLCGRNSVQVNPPLELLSGRLDLKALAGRLGAHGEFEVTPMLIRGRLNGDLELTVFADGRAIVRGTTDPAVARSVYARYVGA